MPRKLVCQRPAVITCIVAYLCGVLTVLAAITVWPHPLQRSGILEARAATSERPAHAPDALATAAGTVHGTVHSKATDIILQR